MKQTLANKARSDHVSTTLFHTKNLLNEAGAAKTIHKNPSSFMSNFQKTLDDVKNVFLTNPEDLTLLVGVLTELDNLIENTNDELCFISAYCVMLSIPLQS